MIVLIVFMLAFFPWTGAMAQSHSAGGEESALLSRIQQSPGDPLARDYLGEFYLSRSAFDKAIAAFQTAISLDPADLRGRYDLASAYEEAGRYQDALIAYQDAGSWSLYQLDFREGLCYSKLGDYQDALAAFRKVEAVRSTPGVHYAAAIAEAGLKDYPNALKELETARSLDPDFIKGKEFFSSRQALRQSRADWSDKTNNAVLVKIGFAVAGGVALPGFFLVGRFFFRKRERAVEEEY